MPNTKYEYFSHYRSIYFNVLIFNGNNPLVTISVAAGFFGHLGAGVFQPQLAHHLALAGLIGGFFGAKMALKSKPKNLKYFFAGIQLVASMIIIANVLQSL